MHRPLIEVEVDGRPVSAGFYSVLIEATVTDNADDEEDQLSLVLDDADNLIEEPAREASITVRLGYSDGDLVSFGPFRLQTAEYAGGPEGQRLTLQATTADMRKRLTGEGREAFEGKTVGEIARVIGTRNGFKAFSIDPAINTIAVSYRLRLDRSDMDFLRGLAAEHGGVLKVTGDRLVVAKRGEGKGAAGAALPELVIRREDCTLWRVSPRARVRYGRIEAGWTDALTGRRRTVSVRTGEDGPTYVLRGAFEDEETATRAAKARGGALKTATAKGEIEMAGRPDIQAGRPIRLGAGFREALAGPWVAESLKHRFRPRDGFSTEVTLQVKAPGE